MIKNLENIYINIDDSSVASIEPHESVTYGYNRSKYYGPKNTYLILNWEFNKKKISIKEQKAILSFPNKEYSSISLLIKDKSKKNGSFIKIFNDEGVLINTLDLPNLKIFELYPKMTYKPSISLSWYNNERIKTINENTNVEINPNTDLEVTFWFPNYREEAVLNTNEGKFSKIYFTVDEEKHIDPSKNIPIWY